MYRKFGEIWNGVFKICERTDRQTDRYAITSIAVAGEVKTVSNVIFSVRLYKTYVVGFQRDLTVFIYVADYRLR